ncbi:MAG: hypothetical protein A2X94_10925 [Bdellovibrionales bacterium GWB1_55_8]|nr:MAG: hypothetical protein A2X94_10925 [Bdellovibrionales bacterium GWB1_55_8]
MKKLMAFVLAGVLGYSPAALAKPTAEEVVRAVDEVRNPADSFFMKVEVADAGNDSRNVFEVSIRGNNRTLVKTLEPARDRGRNLLMLDEEMWAYVPNIRRAVRVSLGQKLSGQAANGDISRMRWSGDYDAVIEKEDAKVIVILLTARKKGLTYEKIRASIEPGTFHPIQAEFLSPSGKPLKLAKYAGFKPIAGRVRPTEIQIQDAVRENDRSVVKVLSMEPRQFPESLFNQNALR